MKKYVKIPLDDLVALHDRITLLEQRLSIEGQPEQTTKPVNALESLPDTFTTEQVEELGLHSGTPSVWKTRGYVTSNSDGSFTKTQEFLKRVEQAKVMALTNAVMTRNRTHHENSKG